MKKVIFGILALLVLGGCATPNAGGVASGISITIYADRFSGPGPSDAFVVIRGDGNGMATAAPETGSQSASATTTPSIEVPASVIP